MTNNTKHSITPIDIYLKYAFTISYYVYNGSEG